MTKKVSELKRLELLKRKNENSQKRKELLKKFPLGCPFCNATVDMFTIKQHMKGKLCQKAQELMIQLKPTKVTEYKIWLIKQLKHIYEHKEVNEELKWDD